MTINLQILKRIDLIVGGICVGSIPLSLAETIESTSNDASSQKESSNLESDCLIVNGYDPTRLETKKCWTEQDDKALIAAVSTLGLDAWDRIVKYWFSGSKTKSQCIQRWNKLAIELHPTDKVGQPKTNILTDRTNIKQISVRKRREMEAIEERKLFGKERPQLEKELIHRAYVVGQNKLDKIMRMNDAGSKEKFGTTISFSSIVTEMEQLDPSDVEFSRKCMSKSLRKLPRSVMEISEQKLFSPIDTNDDNITITSTSNNNHLLNFNTSQLPVAQIIEKERVRIMKMENEKRKKENNVLPSELIPFESDYEKDILTQCLSPPLTRPFPYLLD